MAVPRLLRGCGRGSTRDNTVHQGSRRAETHTDTAAILYLCGHNNARSRIFYRSTHSLCGSPAPGQCDNHRDLGKRRIRCAPSNAESAAASTVPSDNADNSDCNISSYAQGKTDKVSDTIAAEDLDTGNPAVVGKDTSGSVSGAADSSDNDTEKAEVL